MKITKEMLASIRRPVDRGYRFIGMWAEQAEALLDERKALREALDQACGEITNWRHKEAVAALALGEDEG